jgi:hypothetical protein
VNVSRLNVLSGRFEDEGRNSRRGRKPLSAGDYGIGNPKGGLRGLAFGCCIVYLFKRDIHANASASVSTLLALRKCPD